ncbi:hypothetical protein HaLaN_02910, partial [Haematococcus lacustris]
MSMTQPQSTGLADAALGRGVHVNLAQCLYGETYSASASARRSLMSPMHLMAEPPSPHSGTAPWGAACNPQCAECSGIRWCFGPATRPRRGLGSLHWVRWGWAGGCVRAGGGSGAWADEGRGGSWAGAGGSWARGAAAGGGGRGLSGTSKHHKRPRTCWLAPARAHQPQVDLACWGYQSAGLGRSRGRCSSQGWGPFTRLGAIHRRADTTGVELVHDHQPVGSSALRNPS